MLTAIGQASALVDLEIRPSFVTVRVGEAFDLRLFAVAKGAQSIPVSALDAVVIYDSSFIAFQNISPVGEPYDWLVDGFVSPSPGGINDALDDGTMQYTAWGQLGEPAIVTPAGLRVTTFTFLAESPTCGAMVTIPMSYGSAYTRVFDGVIPNKVITGATFGARVMVVPEGYLVGAGEVRARPDEEVIDFAGSIVTRVFPESGYFYVEDPTRCAGIRVNCDSASMPTVGKVPSIHGVVRTIDGEKLIDSATVTVSEACGPLPTPAPLAMNTLALGPNQICAQGLLARVSGKALESGSDLILTDGSPTNVKLDLHCSHSIASGARVTVVGMIGADATGPVIRINDTADIRVY